MTDRDDDGDPLLVRPYLLGEPDSAAPPASTQTWPEAAAEPAAAPDSPDATVPIRLPAPPPRGRLRRRPLVLLVAAALTLALVGAAALAASLLPEPRTPSALPIDGPLPSLAAPAPAPASTAATTGAARTATAATTRPQAAGSQPATSAPTTRPTTAGPSAVPATTTASPAADQLIPPAADRVGRIHGNGDLCLDLNGALAVDGTQIQVYTCNDTAAQRWTVAADGTLRIVGKCAAAADDGAVRLAGCDGRRAEQWRAGPDDSLVNLATDGCLTDPSTGTQSGAAVRIEECAAAERQRWKLP
ncbi:hypothetical protein DMB66_03605 [Actinoplanes sp. ATCC 53533]|uniref:RICIN domain-containing protein n=1 Tax=Actinoplanes sp. ATCC 53533 TaxID=1288362 RepID=UPI000F782C59|nr:RICIN domain-containing protein [Actinoplanes sp. ATCC 53533]RSM73133.1 hypothetical protein DMB66_03605 [Actinoplanes sp. ATCC 53533]